ncbi:MAG: MmgE/PrpD family protein [Lautropia sp.]
MSESSATLAEELAAFVAALRFEDLPDDVLERLRLHALDLVGVCLLSARLPFADMLVATVAQSEGRAEATLIGRGGLRLPAPSAALFMGGVAHGNEFDDTYAPGRWHGSAATLPALLCTAQALGSDGRRFMVALAAALEVGCRLTRAAPGLLGRGFHSTATAGVLASALGVGRLHGFDARQLAASLGVAGCFASGTAEFLDDPQAWPKRIQVGYAAQGAILAARAVAHGFSGPRRILEGRHGYFNAHAGEGRYDLASITRGLGEDWELLKLYPKRYPCDHIAQGYLDCAIAIGRDARPIAEDIARVEAVVHPLVTPVMFEPRALRYAPDSGWSARWSMPFNLAVALLDRSVTIDTYTDARAHDPATRALMQRVEPVEDSTLPFPSQYPARVRVHLRSGRALERSQMHVAGAADNPLTAGWYEEKFVDNASRSLDAATVQALLARFRALPDIADIGEIAALYG